MDGVWGVQELNKGALLKTNETGLKKVQTHGL